MPTTEVIALDVSVEVSFSGMFVGYRTERDRFSLRLTLSGEGETRAAALEPFTITRKAEIAVTPRDGELTVSTGELRLSGAVNVRFAGLEQGGEVTLSTGSASSPYGRYSGNGSRLDPSTLTLVLVGGGAVDVSVLGQELTYEYFVTATCVLATRPA